MKLNRTVTEGRAQDNDFAKGANYDPELYRQIQEEQVKDKWANDEYMRANQAHSTGTQDRQEGDKFDTVRENNENTLKVLNAIYENTLMGKESCDLIAEYAEDNLADSLKEQVIKYEEYSRMAQIQANNLGETLEDKTKGARTMAKMSMKLKLVGDKSATNIAKMIILGATNGVIDLGRVIRHTTDVSQKAGNLAREVLDYEERTADSMKYYL